MMINEDFCECEDIKLQYTCTARAWRVRREQGQEPWGCRPQPPAYSRSQNEWQGSPLEKSLPGRRRRRRKLQRMRLETLVCLSALDPFWGMTVGRRECWQLISVEPPLRCRRPNSIQIPTQNWFPALVHWKMLGPVDLWCHHLFPDSLLGWMLLYCFVLGQGCEKMFLWLMTCQWSQSCLYLSAPNHHDGCQCLWIHLWPHFLLDIGLARVAMRGRQLPALWRTQ